MSEVGLSESGQAFVALAFAAQLPLRDWNAELIEVKRGQVRLRCPVSEPLTTSGTGMVMGGIIATLADVAAGLACVSALEPPRPVTTIDFTSHQLAPARGEWLEVIGTVERVGKSICIAAAEVFAVSGTNRRKCARLTGTFIPG
jgi:uncharacterized protein (TIGR00369 family)